MKQVKSCLTIEFIYTSWNHPFIKLTDIEDIHKISTSNETILIDSENNEKNDESDEATNAIENNQLIDCEKEKEKRDIEI